MSNGTNEQVQSLIKLGDNEEFASIIVAGDVSHPIDFDNALLLAAKQGDARIVQTLLDAGANVNARNSNAETALHLAAERGHCDVVRLLVARGADLALVDNGNQTALGVSSRKFREDVTIALIEGGAPLREREHVTLIASTSVACFHALHKRHVNFSELHDLDGGSPCVVAADRSNDPALLELLVRVGGLDVNEPDVDGFTCLHMCASSEHYRVLRWLINAGADVDAVTALGQTPLLIACICRLTECALMLIAAGADVNVDSSGRTACHHAIRGNAVGITHALVAAGANVEGYSGSSVWAPDDAQIECSRRRIAKVQLDFVRERALQVCLGLQSRGLDALQMCEVLLHACGPVAPLIPFHRWWTIATTVKHFGSVS
jgi:ankyrin repeat protein